MEIYLSLFFCVITLISGCTLIGYKLGESVDKATDSDKFANQYAGEGSDIDIEIGKALLAKKDKIKETWNDPWVKEQEQKYCSQIPSCWNKRSIKQENTAKPYISYARE